MKSEFKFFNRDISWLSFNHRVLEEAGDPAVPLYDRIKFLAIYSNNLEEFYRVRVSYYRNLLRELPVDHPKIKEVNPAGVIEEINKIVSKSQEEFSEIFRHTILHELRDNRIFLIRPKDHLSATQKAFVKRIYATTILPFMQPVLLKRKLIKPFLKTGQLYIIIKLKNKFYPDWIQRPSIGMIKIPTDHDIPRFVELPEEKGNYYIMFLEDLIMRRIHTIFPGYNVLDWYSVKVTRDADLDYDEYMGDDLIDVIERIDSTRELGRPHRFQYDHRINNSLLGFIKSTFDLDEQDLVKGGSIHNFRDFFKFPNPLSPRLEYEKMVPLRMPEIDSVESMIAEIGKRDLMLHYPYQSFNYFIRFLQEAANDPNVYAIKSTQYRVAMTNSAVVNAFISAAENGKKVTVFVELKARFDEETNLHYAKEMKQAGVKIIYSIPGLKVHSKVVLIQRNDSEGKPADVAYFGTGNFNEKTARIYVDHGMFTGDKVLVSDLCQFFDYLENQSVKPRFEKIWVPGFNFIENLKKCIHREIEFAEKGKEAYMLFKMNGLEDPNMITELYKASLKGVKIDLIIRGVCRLVPNQSYSKNIRLIRIVDRFLEHDRVYYFRNNGADEIYSGSADWMRRNLYRRIECVFPIEDKNLKKELKKILNIQLKDNVKARIIDENLNCIIPERSEMPVRSQVEIYKYLEEKYC